VARIAGVDLPKGKRAEIGLRYIYGIGPTSARNILKKTGIDFGRKVDDLTDEEVAKLRNVIEAEYKVEGALRAEVAMNVKRLIDIGTYRGLRHKRGLPVRGQRTHTNARTRRGPKKGSGTLKRRA
jgi:small subunit ribosomal protein S13